MYPTAYSFFTLILFTDFHSIHQNHSSAKSNFHLLYYCFVMPLDDGLIQFLQSCLPCLALPGFCKCIQVECAFYYLCCFSLKMFVGYIDLH